MVLVALFTAQPSRLTEFRYFSAPPGKRRSKLSILPESARQEFKEIEVLCTEYKGLTKSQEIELFQRVQLGKPLTRAEAFRATQGGWQDFAKSYENEFADVINRKHFLRATTTGIID